MSAKGVAAASAAVAGLIMAAGAGHGGHHRGISAVLDSLGAIPYGSAYTPSSWASAFLRAAGERRTSCNRRFVIAWEAAEGGAWDNDATGNPLDTTQREPGSYAINSIGVQAYPSWHEGLRASVVTLGNGGYPGIISCLQAGDDAQACADAVAASGWGTEPFTATC